MSSQENNGEQWELDPVYLHARREAVTIVGLFVGFLIWSVSVCYWFGYVRPRDPAELQIILGMPAWVFWGLFLPWIAVDIIAVWFCFVFMRDDDLENPDSMETPDHG